MRLVHYSAKGISKFTPTPLAKRGARDGGGVGDKPAGLWVSDDECDQNWLAWCVAEGFGLERLRVAQEVILRPNASILCLGGAPDLDHFVDRYGAPLYPGARHHWIDWEKVCAVYDGVVITPYVWERRLDGPIWYYGWDCASGCLWGDVVESIGAPAVDETRGRLVRVRL